MKDGGNHYMLFSYVSKNLIGSRFLGLKFSLGTVKYLMSVFVRPCLLRDDVTCNV